MAIRRVAKGFKAAEEVDKRFRAMKLGRVERPMDGDQPLEVSLPEDITQVQDELLGRLYSDFARMSMFAACHVGETESKLSIVKKDFALAVAEETILYAGKAGLLKATLATHPRLQPLEEEITVLTAVLGLAKAMMKSMNVGRDSCSREITRRVHLRLAETSRRS